VALAAAFVNRAHGRTRDATASGPARSAGRERLRRARKSR